MNHRHGLGCVSNVVVRFDSGWRLFFCSSFVSRPAVSGGAGRKSGVLVSSGRASCVTGNAGSDADAGCHRRAWMRCDFCVNVRIRLEIQKTARIGWIETHQLCENWCVRGAPVTVHIQGSRHSQASPGWCMLSTSGSQLHFINKPKGQRYIKKALSLEQAVSE